MENVAGAPADMMVKAEPVRTEIAAQGAAAYDKKYTSRTSMWA